MGYPNREVRQSLNRSVLRYLVKDATRQMANSTQLYRLLEANDAEKYRGLGHPIHPIGVEFSKNTRNITAFEVASG